MDASLTLLPEAAVGPVADELYGMTQTFKAHFGLIRWIQWTRYRPGWNSFPKAIRNQL